MTLLQQEILPLQERMTTLEKALGIGAGGAAAEQTGRRGVYTDLRRTVRKVTEEIGLLHERVDRRSSETTEMNERLSRVEYHSSSHAQTHSYGSGYGSHDNPYGRGYTYSYRPLEHTFPGYSTPAYSNYPSSGYHAPGYSSQSSAPATHLASQPSGNVPPMPAAAAAPVVATVTDPVAAHAPDSAAAQAPESDPVVPSGPPDSGHDTVSDAPHKT